MKLKPTSEDRKPLLRGMDFILAKTIAEPIVLIISNSIIADLKNREVVFNDIKDPLVYGILCTVLVLWWRSSFHEYWIQISPEIISSEYTSVDIISIEEDQKQFVFI